MNVYKIQIKDNNNVRFVCTGYGDMSVGHVFTKKNTVTNQVNDYHPEQYDVVEYELVEVKRTPGDEWLKQSKAKRKS